MSNATPAGAIGIVARLIHEIHFLITAGGAAVAQSEAFNRLRLGFHRAYQAGGSKSEALGKIVFACDRAVSGDESSRAKALLDLTMIVRQLKAATHATEDTGGEFVAVAEPSGRWPARERTAEVFQLVKKLTRSYSFLFAVQAGRDSLPVDARLANLIHRHFLRYTHPTTVEHNLKCFMAIPDCYAREFIEGPFDLDSERDRAKLTYAQHRYPELMRELHPDLPEAEVA